MNADYNPLRNAPELSPYKKGDVLVLFGELFNRGYANGLVEEAEKRGMTIVRATVGRRDSDGTLRPLNTEESALHKAPFINIPLEAGFDLEPSSKGQTVVDQLRDVKLSEWQNAPLDFAQVAESQKKGQESFLKRLNLYLAELDKKIPEGANVLFAHLMAGGIPRAKVLMPVLNRLFKSTGEKYVESEFFWKTPLGRLSEISFKEVTANTFKYLVEASTPLRQKIEKRGGNVSYIAFGYHGTEILIDDKYQWQTYSPYLQGWAKVDLENESKKFFAEGINTCVYNCPEILTNSSSIFKGVEIPLYPLMRSMVQEAPQHPLTLQIVRECKDLIKEEFTMDQFFKVINDFMTHPEVRKTHAYENWPQHSRPLQMAEIFATVDKIYEMHKDEKKLMTATLSELVFKACGYVMINYSYKPAKPVVWINHDTVAKCLTV